MAEREVSLGTNLYDLNKGMVEQTCKAMSTSAVKDTLEKVGIPYFSNHMDNKYFMLLCHEARDYTIFRFPNDVCYQSMFNELIECFKNRGSVYSIEKNIEDAIEIWLKCPITSFNNQEDYEMRCYFLFPYDIGVIEVE